MYTLHEVQWTPDIRIAQYKNPSDIRINDYI